VPNIKLFILSTQDFFAVEFKGGKTESNILSTKAKEISRNMLRLSKSFAQCALIISKKTFYFADKLGRRFHRTHFHGKGKNV